MSAVFNKIDIREIVRDHYATLYDNRTGKSRGADLALVLGVPVLASVGALVADLGLASTGGLLAAASVIGGLFFALMIMVLQMAADTAARAETEGIEARLLRRVKILREVAANVSYSVVIAILAVVVLAWGEFVAPEGLAPVPGERIPENNLPMWFTAVVLFILTHFIITLLMVLKRTFGVIRRELDLASVPPSRG